MNLPTAQAIITGFGLGLFYYILLCTHERILYRACHAKKGAFLALIPFSSGARICIFAAIMWYLLRSTSLHLILVGGIFVITLWILLLGTKVTSNAKDRKL